jgi:hypothetical protein
MTIEKNLIATYRLILNIKMHTIRLSSYEDDSVLKITFDSRHTTPLPICAAPLDFIHDDSKHLKTIN